MSGRDQFDLQRFVEAQAGVYERACAELREGRKKSHWMWFVFPQILGLGSSEMAVRYGISGIEEAKAYLEHAVLGQRLRECMGIVLTVREATGDSLTASKIFGSPDDLKFRSSMTLFAKAVALSAKTSKADEVFQLALRRYFDGEMDQETLKRI